MKIFPDKLTDSEYVERIRVSLKRRWIKFYIFLGISMVFFAIVYFLGRDLFSKVISLCNAITAQSIPNVPPDSKTLILIGIVAGTLIAVLLFTAGSFLVQTMEIAFSNRKDQMLVKYFDEANKNKNS